MTQDEHLSLGKVAKRCNVSRTTVSRWIIVFALLVVFGWSSFVASQRALTSLESVLLQFAGMAVGVWASFVAGKQSGRDEEVARASGRSISAFRRVTRLYEALGRLLESIESRRQILQRQAELRGSEDLRANQNNAGIYGTVTRIGQLAVGQPIHLHAATEKRERG